ncbi:MAG: bifunctional oligoribonuclease/PAP phosphatase NrnA [Psychrilyobacter sp.]|uniref:DHH family phosphoesterase n=1 Tax=Psychrilyobacter sp. TaxID=2586924 RepID=UPI003C778269
MNNKFSEILNVIKKSDRILITGHTSPDGDAIGSGLALLLALNKLNESLRNETEEKGEIYLDKTLRFILDDKTPKNLKFLTHSILIEEFENYNSKYEFDLMICLDSGNFDRIGRVGELKGKNTKVINIDHHISNDRFGDYNYVGDLSSTSEILFDFIKEAKISLDHGIAESIYTGIVNDTGNFKHSNTTKKVFRTASQLLEHGVEPDQIIKNFFDTKSMAKLKLTGKVLSDFKFVDNQKLVYYYMSEEEITKLGASKDDTSGLGELLLSYEDASVSLFLKEEKGHIKGSFRSKYDVDVNALAGLLGGGGHIKAAGFKTDKSSDEILDIIIKNMSLGGK